VTTDQAWAEPLKPVPGADRSRGVYLDRQQRAALIQKAPADLSRLLKALSLVPLRPGALAALTVSSLDKRLATLTIGKDKEGADRRIVLPPATLAFFVEQTKDKLPSEPLFARADGKAWDKDSWKGPVRGAAAAAELPDTVTAYALRHSVITDLVGAGLDVLTVGRLSGTSVAMIEKHYGHLRSEAAAAALASLAL
jgi:integrase